MSFTEEIGNALAKDALAAAERSGDESIIDEVGKALAASSQTAEEAYLTAIRVFRAEARARAMLEAFNAKHGHTPPQG